MTVLEATAAALILTMEEEDGWKFEVKTTLEGARIAVTSPEGHFEGYLD